MGELSKLPNISKVIEGKLLDVGINTIEQLSKTGSNEAFIKIRVEDSTACINMLYALEGAIEGIRWHNLNESIKKELKEFYNSL